MSVACRTVGNMTVVSFSGRLDTANAPERRAELKELIQAGNANIAIEMGDVDFVDSTGLSVLITALKLARKAGGDVVLVRLSSRVRSLVELTRLHHIFGIFEDEESAAAEFDS